MIESRLGVPEGSKASNLFIKAPRRAEIEGAWLRMDSLGILHCAKVTQGPARLHHAIIRAIQVPDIAITVVYCR
jgi:hypothetical protein